MEDYFYILAGIAYLAYLVYSANQKQKKKQQQAAQEPQAEAEVSEPVIKTEPRPSIFNEILGLQNFEFDSERELYEEEEFAVEEDIIDVVPKEEGIRTTEVQTRQNEKEAQEEIMHFEEELEEKTLDYEFDLRDAIISSEILNPPYIDR